MSNGKIRLWARGLIAAFDLRRCGRRAERARAMGISPEHFNLQDPSSFWLMVAYSAGRERGDRRRRCICKQSPLPPE
jgi:hypothetical protein